VINVKNLHLFEPSLLDGEEEEQGMPTIENFAPSAIGVLEEDTILQKKVQDTCRGHQ